MRGKAQATLVLEQAILDIVEKRAPIRVRGVCYALVVRKFTKSMDARSRAIERPQTRGNPDSIIRAAVRGCRCDNWRDQPTIVEVWSEKSTVQGVLAPVLDEHSVTFRITKGLGSFTAVKRTDDVSNVLASDQKQAVVLCGGDWDPRGLSCASIARAAMSLATDWKNHGWGGRLCE